MPRYCRSKFYLFICGAWPPSLLLFFSDIIANLAIMYALAHLMNGRYENCNCRYNALSAGTKIQTLYQLL